MKPKVNKRRRAGNGFNVLDPSGYKVRFERANDGSCWHAKPDALMVLSCGTTLRQTKLLVSEAIQWCIESYAEEGLDLSQPERTPTLVHSS